MLTITIPEREYFDERTSEFVTYPAVTLQFEHSLISVSKWESKWHKPFLDNKQKTDEELLDYIKCMSLTKNVDPEVYNRIPMKSLKEIVAYIENPMTATWFSERKGPGRRNSEVVTSELIYYWMTALNIPFECQKWHLNRLMTLIRICNVKQEKPKKMSRNKILSQQAALNEARRKAMGTNG